MNGSERRRAGRHDVDLRGELFLSAGRCIPVRIVNLGQLGALVQVADLEEAVLEGERVVLGHPLLSEPEPASPGTDAEAISPATSEETARTPGSVVRVDLEFASTGVSLHLSTASDGGAPPEGCTA